MSTSQITEIPNGTHKINSSEKESSSSKNIQVSIPQAPTPIDNVFGKKDKVEYLALSSRNKTNRDDILELSWNNLSIASTKINKGKNKNVTDKSVSAPKKILDNVYGKIQSGEALAILGGSGAGKTTLLNYLSKKIETANLKIDGDVILNNEKADSIILNSLSSYVMQDDVLEANMTPLEILLFTAKLKLTNLSDEQIEIKVLNMIKKLNLENAMNTKIGNNLIRGVSGGERKRISIGVELISDPQIVFLDEPTTGLDSFNAFEVVRNICQLAREDNKLIIFTIHQPSSEIFSLLDKVCILADGKNIYFGPQNKCLDCFDVLFKLPCKLNYNPFEHFLEMTTQNCIFNSEVRKSYPELKATEEDGDEVILHTYSNHMKNLSELFLNNRDNFYNYTMESKGFSDEIKQMIKNKKVSRGFLYEFNRLFERNILVSQRNPQALLLKIVQNIFTSVLMSIVFQNLSTSATGIQDRAGVIFFLITGLILSSAFSSILIFVEQQNVFLRERSNQLYSVISYYLAKVLSELPIFFITVNCLVGIVFWATNLNDTFSYKYYAFNGVLQLAAICGGSYSFFLGSLVSDAEALSNLNNAILIPIMLLCGFFASSDNYAPYLKPFEYISAFKYSLQALTEVEFTDLKALSCSNSLVLPCDPLKSRFTYNEPMYLSIILIPIIALSFNIFAFLFQYFRTKIKA